MHNTVLLLQSADGYYFTEIEMIATARALNVTIVVNLYNYHTRRMTQVGYPHLPVTNDTHNAIHLTFVQDSRHDRDVSSY
jgi:hypothetical protein